MYFRSKKFDPISSAVFPLSFHLYYSYPGRGVLLKTFFSNLHVLKNDTFPISLCCLYKPVDLLKLFNAARLWSYLGGTWDSV